MMSKKQRKYAAFTLVELLVALMIGAIVLAAAATMAGALASGKAAIDRMSRNAAYLLQIQTRLSDLIMRANDAPTLTSSKLVLWHDDNHDKIAVDAEKTTIESDGVNLTIYKNDNPTSKNTYKNCQFVGITNKKTALDNAKSIQIQFALTEGGVTQTYSVIASLRAEE